VNLPATAPFNQDEETSGIVDVSSILGAETYLFVTQAHYLINATTPNGFSNPDELVEGGQLMLLRTHDDHDKPCRSDRDDDDDRGGRGEGGHCRN
jgi:hypothetical protein